MITVSSRPVCLGCGDYWTRSGDCDGLVKVKREYSCILSGVERAAGDLTSMGCPIMESDFGELGVSSL